MITVERTKVRMAEFSKTERNKVFLYVTSQRNPQMAVKIG
jgi:hypothetical protein